jgi:hypothetical protein
METVAVALLVRLAATRTAAVRQVDWGNAGVAGDEYDCGGDAPPSGGPPSEAETVGTRTRRTH